MTSLFFKHSFNTLKRFPSCSSSSLSRRRAIHFTSVVHKKAAKVDIEDLFGDEGHDLFSEETIIGKEPTATATTTKDSSTTKTTTTKGSLTSTAQPPKESSSTTRKRLSITQNLLLKRSALLNKNIAFVKPRLGSSPAQTHPMIRSRTWLTMIQLAKDGEDMRQVVDLIPIACEGGGVLPGRFAQEFVRRCEQLGCQNLALEVFGDYAKYNIVLTPNAGRWLIHSLHVLHPLQDLLIAASLFSVYNITLAEDLVSASMFTAACLKHDTTESKAVANLLLPQIKKMVEEKRREGLTMSVKDVEVKRQMKWVDWSLKKINKFVKKSGEPLLPFLATPQVQQASVVQP